MQVVSKTLKRLLPRKEEVEEVVPLQSVAASEESPVIEKKSLGNSNNSKMTPLAKDNVPTLEGSGQACSDNLTPAMNNTGFPSKYRT